MKKLKAKRSVVIHLADFSIYKLDGESTPEDINQLTNGYVLNDETIASVSGVVEIEGPYSKAVKDAATRVIDFTLGDRLLNRVKTFLAKEEKDRVVSSKIEPTINQPKAQKRKPHPKLSRKPLQVKEGCEE